MSDNKSLIQQIHKFVFPYINSNMYVLMENRSALVVDPHSSAEAIDCMKKNGVLKVLCLLTHEHFDHTNGISNLRMNFNTHLICQQNAISPKSQKYSNRPTVVSIILRDRGMDKEADEIENQFRPYTYTAEETFDTHMDTVWEGHRIHLESTPGHSPSSCLIWLDDIICFTGDSLIPNTETTTRWPGSNAKLYYSDTLPKLQKISASTYIFPGHGDPIKMDKLKYADNMFTIV